MAAVGTASAADDPERLLVDALQQLDDIQSVLEAVKRQQRPAGGAALTPTVSERPKFHTSRSVSNTGTTLDPLPSPVGTSSCARQHPQAPLLTFQLCCDCIVWWVGKQQPTRAVAPDRDSHTLQLMAELEALRQENDVLRAEATAAKRRADHLQTEVQLQQASVDSSRGEAEFDKVRAWGCCTRT